VVAYALFTLLGSHNRTRTAWSAMVAGRQLSIFRRGGYRALRRDSGVDVADGGLWSPLALDDLCGRSGGGAARAPMGPSREAAGVGSFCVSFCLLSSHFISSGARGRGGGLPVSAITVHTRLCGRPLLYSSGNPPASACLELLTPQSGGGRCGRARSYAAKSGLLVGALAHGWLWRGKVAYGCTRSLAGRVASPPSFFLSAAVVSCAFGIAP